MVTLHWMWLIMIFVGGFYTGLMIAGCLRISDENDDDDGEEYNFTPEDKERNT